MRHPTDGTLRRMLDEPAGVADDDRQHVAGCPACLTSLSAAQQDAALAGAALAVETTYDADLDAAWRRLVAAQEREQTQHAVSPAPARRWRSALRSPVLAVVGVAAVMGGATAAAAGDWLQVFRAEEVGAPSATRAELVTMPEPEDLAAYGDLEVLQEPDLRQVPDAAAAEDASGLPVPEVAELPRGVTGEPDFAVVDQVSAEFTFSAEEAAAAAEAAGETAPPPPAGLDGSRYRLVAGPGQAAVWSEARGVPALVVARAVAPTAYSSGVPFETAVDYLSGLPGMSEETAAQLEEFYGDGTTLPLPFGSDEVSTTTADVDGTEATVVTSRDGLMAGVVWVEDGVVTAVAGSLSSDEVLTVARGLQD